MNNIFLNPDWQNGKPLSTREGFGRGMMDLGRTNEKVVALCADLTESMKLTEFKEEYPSRYFEMGVSEQNMVGVSAGMALSGLIPYAASFAVFSPGRTWDQIRVSVCLANVNVKIIGGHTGLGVGEDGASHQALEDLAIMRVLPNMTVVVPCDEPQAYLATKAISLINGPTYLRLNRQKTPVITTDVSPFVVGKAQVLREGDDLTILSCGPIVTEVLKAVEEVGIDAEVINVHTIKPLDTETIVRSVKKTGKVLVVEDHQIIGGLFGAVAEAMAITYPIKITPLGMENKFGESGEDKLLYEKYGLDKNGIIKKIKEVMK